MSAGDQTGVIGKTAWLSQGLEELLHGGKRDFDVIIVGSGYGGAIAAAELAGCTREGDKQPISVCVLERGREYLSGMFPSRFAELPLHVRFSAPGNAAAKGTRDGLFDIRVGKHVSAVLGNGLGGGSLINAGVMEEPREEALRRFPGSVGSELRQTWFDQARTRLRANRTIDQHPKGAPQKLRAFRQLAPEARSANISIGVKDEKNASGVNVHGCKRCGDCATGCNYGSKNSLDAGLLASAKAGGAEIFTGATVLRISRDGKAWVVHVVHTDEPMRKRQGKPVELRAGHLILAAGTFGSTELLKRARLAGLPVSRHVGRKFSTNGDAIAAIYDHEVTANAVADESQIVDDRNVGPTITGMLDKRPGCVIQEIAIPGPIRRVFEETITTSRLLHELERRDCARHRADEPGQDPCAVNASALSRTSVFVMMGDDGAEGTLKLTRRNPDAGDGAIAVQWKGIKEHKLFGEQIAELQKLAEKGGKKARVLPNPLWQLLPDSMQFLIDGERGPALTVHPLGGCPMGTRPSDGVVDDLGRVFDASDPNGERVFPGLVVLDGSIVPGALGINPALTIAALALRAVKGLRTEWRLGEPSRADAKQPDRPLFSPPRKPAPGRATEIEIVERMSGEAMMRTRDGGELACVVELTLHFEKQAIAALFLPSGGGEVPMRRSLTVKEGKLRIFRKVQWDAWRRRGEPKERLKAMAEVRAPLEGTLELLHREPSSAIVRVGRGLWAWLLNRGLRDTWQAIFPMVRKRKTKTIRQRLTELRHRVCGVFALASRAGEVRLLQYQLFLKEDAKLRTGTPLDTSRLKTEAEIRGVKRLTYSRRSNPWRQLMRMYVTELPGLARGKPALDLDLKYLAGEGVPLFKVVGQNDQAAALVDVGSLLGYFLRLLLNIHIWSFRRPDPPKERKLQQLPPEQGIPGRLPKADVERIVVGKRNRKDVVVKLTGYRHDARPPEPPVLMIHGYSASGTTFAHHAVKPNMAEYFFRNGRDVWIVDMRTSSGMPTATDPWTFEEAALEDIPLAVETICRKSAVPQVDVFAHCMGSAMLSMAVLGDADPNSPDDIKAAHAALPGRIRRAVLSQIAPVVVMSPANIFRGYAMRYLRHFLPLKGYKFRIGETPDLAQQITDRLLATLPYPEKEFDVENPPYRFWRRTPFVGTRHRMDALYGQDFSIADRHRRSLLDDAVLEYIDDLFGPLSIETVAQTIHFARAELITNHMGRNRYVEPQRIFQRWKFPTMSIHGEDNGLSDVATLHRFQRRFRDEAETVIRTHVFPGFGHQDSLIGRKAPQVFDVVYRFLENPDAR